MNRQQLSLGLLRITEILYLSLSVLSYYLLFASRTEEARTVWQVLNPAFIPTLFVATSLLVIILFSSEKTSFKLLFIIVISVLTHSFFSIVFPAGDLSGQQIALGRIRLVFDNVTPLGSNPTTSTVYGFIYELFRGIHFQAAMSVIFARMLSLDILWVHLSLIPVLWGVFVPIATFLITKTLGGNDNVSALSSLLLSAFPYLTYFGAISVPNSLGFIFFFYSLYFILKSFDSDDSKTTFLMLAFSFSAFLSHYLTGIMSFSFVFLALVLKAYRSERKASPLVAKGSLVITFLFCVSLLPLSLVYLKFFTLPPYAVFTLDKFYELPFGEILGLSLVGELIYAFDIKIVLVIVIGSAIGFLWMVYQLYRFRGHPDGKYQIHVYFLFAAFLIILIDYAILKLFMSGLPLNGERLWVFRDFIAVPFVGLAICSGLSSVKTYLKPRSVPTITAASLKTLQKGAVLRVLSLLLILNALVPLVLGGWVAFSLTAAYPQVAPLQTTSYELEAVKYIQKNTPEKYVVIGDIWTIYAGEVIVGINNPRAYYFAELDKTGHDLFVNMTQEPSPQWMLLAMNYTDTTVAYFIITQPRLGTEEFNRVVSLALQNKQLTVISIPNIPSQKLYVFSYRKE